MNSIKRISVLFLCVVFCLIQQTVQAQVDTLRGRVPYFHYNYYDSNWCKIQMCQGVKCAVTPLGNIVNRVGYHISHDLVGGYFCCTYRGEDRSEVAIRMDMDSTNKVSGVVFGYNYAFRFNYNEQDLNDTLYSIHLYDNAIAFIPFYNTVDYIFNIYDESMYLIWSDTVATEDLRIDYYYEAGYKDYRDVHDRIVGYESPAYIGLCKINFDTILQMPETFYIGITSSTPINTPQNTILTITSFIQFDDPGHISTSFLPYETRRYRIAPGKGDSIQYWADEECHYGVQTCLYPILVLPCGEVTGLRCQALGGAGRVAFVEWDAGDNNSAYEISYGPEGTPAGEGTVYTPQIPQYVTAIDRNTHYDFYVRARCDLDTTKWSAWSEPLHVHLASMAINGAEEPVEWSLTPNPAHESATVQCEVGMTSVELLTVKGERIMLRDMAGEPTCSLDLSGLAKGIYIVQVTTPKGTAARKLAVE